MTLGSGRWVRALWLVLAMVIVFFVAFGAGVYRIDRAPDILTDEIVYTRAGIRLAGQGDLVWDTGARIYVHPPLYFAVEAFFWRFTSHPLPPMYAAGDIFSSVYHARLVNVTLGALTAVVLLLFVWRLGGPWLGFLLAILFALDPFALRINRRAMLETMSGLLAMTGMAVFLLGGIISRRNAASTGRRASLGWSIVAGLLLGMAMLAKEIVFTAIVAVVLFGLWEAWRGRRSTPEARWRAAWRGGRPAFVTAVVATLTYGIYPIWALLTSNVSAVIRMLASGRLQPGFLQVKYLSLERLLGLIQITGWNRPGVSLGQFLFARLTAYGSSYVLIGLGGLATLWLLWRHRQDPAARLLGVWGVVLYPFYGFVALFGTGNDQFFYLLLVPAIVIIGYAVYTFLAAERSRPARLVGLAVLGLLVVAIVPYDLYQWYVTDGIGNDNVYYRLVQYVDQTLPQDVPVNATGDISKFWYFFPGRSIGYAGTPEEARAIGVHYFFLAPKDAQDHYGRMTPEFGAWIEAHGVLLDTGYGNSYGQISLYRIDQVTGSINQPSDIAAARLSQQNFRPPLGNPAAPFLIGLGAWIVVMVALAALLDSGIIGSPVVSQSEAQPLSGHPREPDHGHEQA
jgi:4-amino-4-deoxy-L-arabinose transferase-like glycosyltransferase